jgi:subtilisin family serine protease
VIAAMQWAVDHGAQVTNHSYGSTEDPGVTVLQAFANAEAEGLLHVAAAGNTGTCEGTGDSVLFPARYAAVIAVAATDALDRSPCFSSTGPDVELSAPGVAVNSTTPGGGYQVFSGTSMASPHVAGVAALVLSQGQVTDANGNQRANEEVRQRSGSHTVSLVVADARGVSGSASTSFTVSLGVKAQSITCSVSGSAAKRTLSIVVSAVDPAGGAPVQGAKVTVHVAKNGAAYYGLTATTNSSGKATFSIKNAPSACYTTAIAGIAIVNRIWDVPGFDMTCRRPGSSPPRTSGAGEGRSPAG